MTFRPRTQRLVDVAFGVGWAATRHTPERLSAKVLEAVADRIWKREGPGPTQLEANLKRAAPGLGRDELRELSRRAMQSYFRYWHEVLRLQSWSDQRICDGVVTTNIEPLRDVHARGRGSIVALPHMANWDLCGAWACLNGLPVSTIAERLRPESLFDRFVAYREAVGMEVVPLTGSSDPLSAMRAALGRERMVCLLSDRSFGRGGVEVTLLGEPARLPGGVAVLSRISRTPVVVVVPTYRGTLLHMQLSDPIEPVLGPGGVVATTQRIADVMSAGIREFPHDWHMLQRVFVADLERSGEGP